MYLKNIRAVFTQYLFGSILIFVILLFAAAGEGFQQVMRYERLAIGQGEWWRLITAHWVHLGWMHTLLNLGGVLVFSFMYEKNRSAVYWFVALLLQCIFISVGFWLFDPTLQWYVGLSGVLHGLLILGAIAMLGEDRLLGLGVLLIVIGKLAWEQITGADVGTEAMIGGAVVTHAHLYGGIIGVLMGVADKVCRGAKRKLK